MSRNIFMAAAVSMALALVPFLGSAQNEHQPQMKATMSAREIAERQTNRLAKELHLTEKQYKKVYSLNLQEQRLREDLMEGGPAADRHFEGFPGGQGGPGMDRPAMGDPGNRGGSNMERPSMDGAPKGAGRPDNGSHQMNGYKGQGGPDNGSHQMNGHEGQGGPGMNGRQMGPRPGGPRRDFSVENSAEMQKFRQKKEQKMRKILTIEQFAQWKAMGPRG
ncbi:MAG: hypothetical protein HUJ91_07775 [Bacteroidales bacterium]|nr:hypothetical protein [Bacteroidales bacterium]